MTCVHTFIHLRRLAFSAPEDCNGSNGKGRYIIVLCFRGVKRDKKLQAKNKKKTPTDVTDKQTRDKQTLSREVKKKAIAKKN